MHYFHHVCVFSVENGRGWMLVMFDIVKCAELAGISDCKPLHLHMISQLFLRMSHMTHCVTINVHLVSRACIFICGLTSNFMYVTIKCLLNYLLTYVFPVENGRGCLHFHISDITFTSMAWRANLGAVGSGACAGRWVYTGNNGLVGLVVTESHTWHHLSTWPCGYGVGLKIRRSGVQLSVLVICRGFRLTSYCFGPPSSNGYLVHRSRIGSIATGCIGTRLASWKVKSEEHV